MGRNRDDSAQMWQRHATCITVSTSNTNPSHSTQCRAGFTCPSGSGCLLEVRFCPQTSWNGLCMAYAWPMHGLCMAYASWCDFSIPRVGCIATRANANLGDPLPLHLALPRPPTQNLIGSKYVLQSCPSFATFSNTCWVICNFAIIHLCCHAMCWEATVASQQHASLPALPAPMETTRRLMARERRGTSYSGVNGVSKNTM